jgi:hypothetical protein
MSGVNDDADGAYDVPQNGETPVAACSPVIDVPAAKLVACANQRAGVIVYESDGSANQCESLHLSPLPVGYATANARVHALDIALARAYDRHSCTKPPELAREADAALRRLGFTGWRAQIDTRDAARQSFAGPCGEYPSSGNAISDSAAALNAADHTIMIEIGASRAIQQLVDRTQMRTLEASGKRCYTLASIQQMVRSVLDTAAHRLVPVKLASTQERPYTTAMLGRQRFYDQGCAIVVGFGTAIDGRTFLVQLADRYSPPSSPSGDVPHSAYRPVLKAAIRSQNT